MFDGFREKIHEMKKAVVLRGLLELFVMNECRKWSSPKKIFEKIKKETNDNWTPNLAAFYSTFRKFERNGFTTARLTSIKDKKKIEYKLTKKGVAELEKRKRELKEGVKKNAFVMMRMVSSILCDGSEKRKKLMKVMKEALGEAYE
jgi:DNA-binding PadR family transcriptional regulator